MPEGRWFVDPSNGSDQYPGSAAEPLASLTQAVALLNRYDGPARIVLAPGTYREGGLVLRERAWPVVIECPTGEAVISGADVWREWRRSAGAYVAEWPHDWGSHDYADFPAGERKHLRPLGGRSEMLFWDGQLLTQVSDRSELVAGSYAVDEAADQLWLKPPAGQRPQRATIEVAVRHNLLTALNLPGLTLRNLVFTKAANGPQHDGLNKYAVLLAGEHAPGDVDTKPDRTFLRNVQIDGCRFVFNNSAGLTLANIVGLQVSDSVFDDNGGGGVGANRLREVRYEDCSFDRNNWRLGGLGGIYGWAPAGTKHLFMADAVFRRCRFNDNLATGLWLDFGHERVLVEDCEMRNNINVGLYVEASAGPVTVRGCQVIGNGRQDPLNMAAGGILMAESMGLLVERCLVTDNLHYQIGVRSRTRPSSGYWSQTTFDGHCRNLRVVDSVLIGARYQGDEAHPDWYGQPHRLANLIGRQIHAEEASYQRFLSSYRGSGNRFAHRDGERVFSTGANYGLDRVDLAGWQLLTGQDHDAQWLTAEAAMAHWEPSPASGSDERISN